MAKARRTVNAVGDLLDIWFYIAADDIAAADRLLDRFESIFSMLARSPMLGRARDELLPGLRSFPVGDYLVFYKLIRGGVAIARVLSGFRSLDDIFGH